MNSKDALYISLASASFFLSYFSRLAWGVLSEYSSLRPTPAESGAVFTLFFLPYIAVQVPAGMISDAMGPKRLLLASLVGLSGALVLSGLAWNMAVELLSSAIMGLSAGWIYPATVKLIAQRFRGTSLARAMGYYSLAWPLSIIALGTTMPSVAMSLGWRWGYFLISITAVLVAALAALVLEDFRAPHTQEALSFRVLAERDVLMLGTGGFMFFFAYWAFAFYAYSYMSSIGIPSVDAGLIYSLSAVAGVASTVLAGRMISYMGLRRTYSVFVPLYGITLFVFGLLRSPLALAADTLLMGFFRFVITPANSTTASVLRGPASAGSVAGAANIFWMLSGAASGVVAPLIYSTAGYEALWISMAAMAAASLVPYSLISIPQTYRGHRHPGTQAP